MKKLLPILLILLMACGQTDQKPMAFGASLAVNNPFTFIVPQIQGDCSKPDTLFSTYVVTGKGKGWFSSGATLTYTVSTSLHRYKPPVINPPPPPPVDTTKPKPPVDTTKPKPPVDTIIVTPPQTRANLNKTTDFETWPQGWNVIDQTPFPGVSIIQSTTYARAGKFSARVALNINDPDVSGSKRSEMRLDGQSSGNIEEWYGMSYYVPATGPEAWAPDSKDCPELITQLHHNNNDFSPPFQLTIFGSQMQIVVATSGNASNPSQSYRNVGTLTPGKWMDYVFHVKWSTGSDGLIETYRDGVKVDTYNGKVGFGIGYYWKMGIYKFIWKENPSKCSATSRVIYIDEIRWGNSKATYADVKPGN